MKRIYALLAVCLCLLLTGCDLWMDGSYHSVVPHREEYAPPSRESMEVDSYDELCNALIQLVADGSQESVIYMVGFNQNQLSGLMDMAIKYTTQSDPIGAYAVDKIDYEVGNNTGRAAIAVNISYIHNRSEILRISHTENMEGAQTLIAEALEDCEPRLVMLVEEYKQTDFAQMVNDYVDNNPHTCMELPQVTEAVYPQSGTVRVVELSFTYQTSRESLRTMQNYVEPVFRAAYLNVSGEEDTLIKFERMYSFLMERSEYTLETSITPSYSLLRHGVGDSESFAVVYAAMCRLSGLDCRVVTGTRDGEPWSWNMICVDGVYSHVDLLRSSERGELIRNSQKQMSGYVWDYSAYPEAITPEPVVPPQTIPELEEESQEPTQPAQDVSEPS